MDSKNNKEFKELDALFEGKLNQIEQQSLFERIKTDKDLAEAYAFRLNLSAALKNNRAQAISKQAAIWEKEASIPNGKSSIKVSHKGWMKYAAAACILCLIGVFTWSSQENTKQTNSLALFEANFKTAIVDIDRSQDSEAAYIYYANRDYEKAIVALQKLGTEEAKFYLANSFLALNEPQKAISTLQQYNGTNFASEVNWLKALAFLKIESPEQAKEILKSIAQTKGSYGHKARKLLESLN